MKVAACKYPVGRPSSFDEFAAKQRRLLGAAASRGAQVAVLPEYLSLELAALFPAEVHGDLHASLAAIQPLRAAWLELFAGLARETGVSEATMSRIETGASEVSAPHLYALARHLGADIASFFAEGGTALRPGARSLTRAGEGQGYTSARLQAEVLNGDLLHKRMHPFRNRTTARTRLPLLKSASRTTFSFGVCRALPSPQPAQGICCRHCS